MRRLTAYILGLSMRYPKYMQYFSRRRESLSPDPNSSKAFILTKRVEKKLDSYQREEENSNKETGARGKEGVIMVIVDIKDQERFDQAAASLTCSYCNTNYSTKADMSCPSEVYSQRGRVKTWRAKCKECVKSSGLKTSMDDFTAVADSIAGKIVTPEDRDEIWAALENAAINLTSFGESFVPLVDVLKTASHRNEKVRSLYQVRDWNRPGDVERDNKVIWPLIYEVIALSDSNKYPSFKIDESTRNGPVLHVTYRREE
jgi:hypothetical protein